LVSSEMLIALLGSAVAASLITALFAKAQTDKSAIVDNIIKERKAWRDKLRALVSYTESSFKTQDSSGVACIEAQLVVLLNPYDKEDLEIINALNRIPEHWEKAHLQEFMDRVAYLLKHDWERVKQESTTRISPQTLALASLAVALIVAVTEWAFALEASLQMAMSLALWLAAAFFFIAATANRPKKGALSLKKILCWVFNEPFREPYRERNTR
jgi:hypothetical protein